MSKLWGSESGTKSENVAKQNKTIGNLMAYAEGRGGYSLVSNNCMQLVKGLLKFLNVE